MRRGVLLLLLTGGTPVTALAQQMTAQAARQVAADAVIRQRRGDFAGGRRNLEVALLQCGNDRECRASIASGLGEVHYRQAAADRVNSQTLYRDAVRYYDQVLSENPADPEALQKKLMVYRAMGPHEWQEPFFADAAQRDPARRSLYFSHQGDYYLSRRNSDSALQAYRRSLEGDPDDPGARNGLVQALEASGRRGIRELLQRGAEWEIQDPAAAADAFGAALAVSLASPNPDEVSAGAALVGLVSVQARGGLPVGVLPRGVRSDWGPVGELRRFLAQGVAGQIPWWQSDFERSNALALAALAQGRQLVTRSQVAEAERFWQTGQKVAPPPSAVRLDLQRELAMLYFRQPELDPGGSKFQGLEHGILASKGGALAAGDLEAAQRYHTALGLIYAQRGRWRGPDARNAERQLTWALEKARERGAQERFYQPLAELRMFLARGLDSLGDRGRARTLYLEAAAAYFDSDDFAGARRSLRAAGRMPPERPEDRRDSVWAVRYFAPTDSGAPRPMVDCTPATIGAWADAAAQLGGAFRSRDFEARQRFKLLADCAAVSRQPQFRVEAFQLVDSQGITLVGSADVERFERVMTGLLGSVGLTYRAGHLERSAHHGGPGIAVSLPSETRPLWLAVWQDDLVAARVAAELGPEVGRVRLRVTDGSVEVQSPNPVPDVLLARIRGLKGVRGVRVVQGGA